MQAYPFSTTCPYENEFARKTKYYNFDAPENSPIITEDTAVRTAKSFLPMSGIKQKCHIF
jgi:hypothetical protein